MRVTRSLQRVDAPWFDRLMHVVSWPGFPPQSRVIPFVLSLFWLALGFPIEAIFQFLAWGTGGISATIKLSMQRARPTPELVRVIAAPLGGTSFPSGHVLIYAGVYGFLAFLVETLVRPARIRRLATSLLVGLVALVGPSRIYLGHHWFTDVGRVIPRGNVVLPWTRRYISPGEDPLAKPPALTPAHVGLASWFARSSVSIILTSGYDGDQARASPRTASPGRWKPGHPDTRGYRPGAGA